MMEKRNLIEGGRTPQADKQGSADELEKRAVDTFAKAAKPVQPQTGKSRDAAK